MILRGIDDEYLNVGSPEAVNPEHVEHKPAKNVLIIGFTRLVFTMIFLLICVWMIWISYSVLAEAVKTYVLQAA